MLVRVGALANAVDFRRERRQCDAQKEEVKLDVAEPWRNFSVRYLTAVRDVDVLPRDRAVAVLLHQQLVLFPYLVFQSRRK